MLWPHADREPGAKAEGTTRAPEVDPPLQGSSVPGNAGWLSRRRSRHAVLQRAAHLVERDHPPEPAVRVDCHERPDAPERLAPKERLEGVVGAHTPPLLV